MLTRTTLAFAAVAAAATVCSGVAAGGPGRNSNAEPSARVAMNYFDGWSESVTNFHFDGLVRAGPNGKFPQREPLSGWTDDSPTSMDVALQWAQADAIDFFQFDWYYPPVDPGLNTALENYRKLPDHHGVGYSLLYVNIDPFVVPNAEWKSTVDAWAAQDFTSPDYARIDGKPVVFIIDSYRFAEQWGGTKGVNEALDELQQAARAHGLPGVYVVGSMFIGTCVQWVGWDFFASILAGQHWDALTQYAYPAAACERDGPVPYAELAEAGHAGWDAYAQRLGFPTIPTVMAGWDPRPWNETPGGHLWWFERTPAEFGASMRDAITWAAENPIPDRPVVLVTSWNELGEGEIVVPTQEDGYSYGRALAGALGVQWSPPPRRSISVSAGKGGSIRSVASNIACPGRCRASPANGTEIRLTALPRRGYRFNGWSGACAGATRTCVRIVDGDLTARATFRRR